MNPAAVKKLSNVLDHVSDAQVEGVNFRKRGPGAIKMWKEMAKREPGNDMKSQCAKVAAPKVERLLRKSKQVDKDLEKLRDAGGQPHDYYDGAEFRDRTKKLLVAGTEFEREANKVVLFLKTLFNGTYPGWKEADVKVTVDSLTYFAKHWTTMKIRLRAI